MRSNSWQMLQVWSCGGGTQSAAIAALICDGKLPKPDHALMVDTEREKSSTWRYVYGTIQPRLKAAGVDLVVIPKSDYATVDLYAKNGDLLLPVFNGTTGKLPGYCSNEWKRRVMDRWLRDHGMKAANAVYWIGYSLGELQRVRAGKYRYPLIYEHPMRRSDCRACLASLGWELPPAGGSACWMCPNMSDREWTELRDHDPADFQKACDLDEEIRQRDANAYLHSSGRPLRDMASVLTDDRQQTLPGCDSGLCFV